MNKKETAVDLYANKGYNCAQAVLEVFSDDINIDKAILKKLAAGFGGGFARNGEVCGVVSAITMIVSNKASTEELSDKALMYKKVNEYLNKFVEKNGSLRCKELLGYDVSIPEQLEEAKKNDIFIKKCHDFIRDGVDILE